MPCGYQIGVIPNAHPIHFAESAGLHDLLHLAKVRRGAVLRARLYDAVVAAGGVHDGAPFADVVGQGLLDIDVLAGLAGEHGMAACQ